eukprot:TRINITY_DN100638_c0_g1_i1.p1 TRINITY_DN100638_c0_g1~~TRINITY_DN100638_c0_g1_i1.p1  ORF type:complete len:766 (-),score=191.43 TRINITY_DN100638_c0_g1_i1:104-2401(-)
MTRRLCERSLVKAALLVLSPLYLQAVRLGDDRTDVGRSLATAPVADVTGGPDALVGTGGAASEVDDAAGAALLERADLSEEEQDAEGDEVVESDADGDEDGEESADEEGEEEEEEDADGDQDGQADQNGRVQEVEARGDDDGDDDPYEDQPTKITIVLENSSYRLEDSREHAHPLGEGPVLAEGLESDEDSEPEGASDKTTPGTAKAHAILESSATTKEGSAASSNAKVFQDATMMSVLRKRIEAIIFKDNMLLVPRKILHNMGRGDKCTRLSDYTEVEVGVAKYQCGQYAADYTPTPELRAYLEEFAGGPGEIPPLAAGKWCADLPPEIENNGSNAAAYWSNCVAPKSGYFNVLRCKEDDIFATIGISAINRDTCVPFHTHKWEEVYWPVKGRSTWRKWQYGSSLKEDAKNKPHFLPSNVLREVETGHSRGDRGLLSIYFRAYDMNNRIPPLDWRGQDRAPMEQANKMTDVSCWHRYCSDCGSTTAGMPVCEGELHNNMRDEDEMYAWDYDPELLSAEGGFAGGPQEYYGSDYGAVGPNSAGFGYEFRGGRGAYDYGGAIDDYGGAYGDYPGFTGFTGKGRPGKGRGGKGRGGEKSALNAMVQRLKRRKIRRKLAQALREDAADAAEEKAVSRMRLRRATAAARAEEERAAAADLAAFAAPSSLGGPVDTAASASAPDAALGTGTLSNTAGVNAAALSTAAGVLPGQTVPGAVWNGALDASGSAFDSQMLMGGAGLQAQLEAANAQLLAQQGYYPQVGQPMMIR